MPINSMGKPSYNDDEKIAKPELGKVDKQQTTNSGLEIDKKTEIQQDQNLKKIEESELKGNIIDVKKSLEDFARNSDGTIDTKKVSSFGLNMGKLGFHSYEEFSTAINLQKLKDKKEIMKAGKGLREKEINRKLERSYRGKLEEMIKTEIPEGTTIDNFFSSKAEVYNQITGAYMEGTYKTEIDNATAYKVKNDIDLGYDKTKETTTEELTSQEMRKASKDIIKFLNSESLSGQERQQIRFFIRTIANIDRNNQNDKPIEKQILEYFASNPNSLSLTKENRMEPNRIKGIEIKEANAKRLQKLAQLYYQSMRGENQTLRRLFYIIQQEGSIAEVKTNFDNSINKAKENEKQIKKESRQLRGDINSEIGKKLNYEEKDLARYKAYINQIKENKTDNKTIVDAITDFDLDGFITHKDAGNKTGLQVKEIISRFGNKSLDNILALTNKIGSKLGLTDKITKENLLLDPAYLILVQSTLKNPAFDITDIVRYGDKSAENIYNLSENSTETINKETNRIINELRNKGIPVEAGLKDILTTSILKAYSDYGYGIGIPLNEFIKGLSLNLGATTLPTGPESFGINIGRNGKKSLGKGRETTGGISTGSSLVFIPMASVQGGFLKSFDNNKQGKSLDIRTTKKIELSGHAIIMPGYTGYGGSLGIDRNKRTSTLEQGTKLKPELEKFFNEILKPAEGKKVFEFNRNELQTKLEEKFKKSKKDTITKAVNNISLILSAYDGLPGNKAAQASTKIAENYTNSRINQSANDINNKRYIGGEGLTVTFFEGIIPIVSILNLKKHKITSYNDSNPETIINAKKSGEGNEKFNLGMTKFIEEINQHILGDIKIENDYIIIPKSTRTEKNLEIRINENMKGLIKTDKEGNLIIHKDTPIRFFDAYKSDSSTMSLNIGEFSEKETDKKLTKGNSQIPNDFISVEKEIDKDKLPIKINPNTNNIQETFRALNKKVNTLPDGKTRVTPLMLLNPVLEGSTLKFYDGLGKVSGQIDNVSNQTKVIIKQSASGMIFEKAENKEQTRLSMQFIENSENTIAKATEIKEFDDIETNKIISQIYADGREIKDNLFHNIIHKNAGGKLANDYDGFNKNIKDGKYIDAKNNLSSILTEINNYTKNQYKKESFVETRKNLLTLADKDEYQLIKILSAFNVLFSRVANVKVDNKGKYTYRYGGSEKEKSATGMAIIEESEKRINTSSDRGFARQFDKYRPNKESLTKNNVKSLFESIKEKRSNIDFSKQEQTKNTISFNHGNPQDFFKLQVNPEIIGNFKIGLDELKNGKNDKFIDDLKSAYINQLVQTEGKLIKNFLKKLGLEKDLSSDQINDLFNKKELDIDNKKYIFDYEQNFGYNPECNNLVRLMQNIKIKTLDKTKIEQKYEAKLEGNGLKLNYGETNSRVNMQQKDLNIGLGIAKKNKKPSTTPGEEEVPDTTPGEEEVPDTTPGENTNPTTTPGEVEIPAENSNQTTTNTGGSGQTGSQEGGRNG